MPQVQLRNVAGQLGYNGTWHVPPPPKGKPMTCPPSFTANTHIPFVLQNMACTDSGDSEGLDPVVLGAPSTTASQDLPLPSMGSGSSSGAFLMPLADFRALFASLTVCYHRPDWHSLHLGSCFRAPQGIPHVAVELHVSRCALFSGVGLPPHAGSEDGVYPMDGTPSCWAARTAEFFTVTPKRFAEGDTR